jgi:hypothetical protein
MRYGVMKGVRLGANDLCMYVCMHVMGLNSIA